MALPSTFVELCEAQQDKKISNVIGVVIDALPPTTTRTGDHMLTFTLDDGTLQHGQKCRLFTKKADELPKINGVGDVVMLRKVRFAYPNGQPLLSTVFNEPPSWAVFHAPIPKDMGIFDNGLKHVRSKKMPLITKEEMEYVITLGQSQDRSKFTVLTENVKEKLAAPSKTQPCLIRDLMLDNFCQIVGEVVKVFFNYDRASLYITDYTENGLLYDYASKKGVQDVDENLRRWSGPPGKYTLMVECWFPHSDWIKEHVQVGDFLRIRNVHIKANKDKQGLIEGALHTDKVHPDTVYATKLKIEDVDALRLRKESLGWDGGFEQKEEVEDGQGGKKRKCEEPEKVSKSRKRRLRDKERQKQKATESTVIKVSSESEPPQATPRTEIREAVNCVNENIRCEKGNYQEKSIAEIRDTSQTHCVTLPNGEVTTMAFMEIMSYATVRIVDFKPSRIEDFAKSVELSAQELQDAQDEAIAVGSEDDSDAESIHSETSLLNKSTQVRRRRWDWKFALLLEDASTPDISSSKNAHENDQLIVWITNADAEYLLGMKALNLRANPRTLAQLRERLFLLWGDLEENKQEEAKRKQEKQSRILGELSHNTISSGSTNSSQATKSTSRPFKCLVEEYGEQIGERWQRRFRMKGTTIMQDVSPVKSIPNAKHGLESWSDYEDEAVEPAKPEIQSLRAPRAG